MFISNTLPLLLLIILILNFTGASALRCAYLKLESSTEESPDLESPTVHSSAVEAYEDKSVQCSQEGSYCFALWHLDTKPTSTSFPSHLPSTNEPTRHRLIAAGCWNNTQDTYCSQSLCHPLPKPSKALNDSKFCCCSGNLCNSKFSPGVSDASVVDAFEEKQQPQFLNLEFESVNIFQDIVRHPLLLFVLIFTLFILTVILVFTICYKSILSSSSNLLKHGKAMDSLHLLESQSLQPPPASQHNFPSTSTSSSSTSICLSSALEGLSFEELVGRGKYGQVWRGQLQNGTGTPTTVAIKVVSEANKRYLVNECRIYSLHRAFAGESSMACYYGYSERLADDGKREYCMAIEYGHQGSLYAYLHQQTLDWTALCRLIKSLAQGLAYLHTEQTSTSGKDERGKKVMQKPSIVHRDMCSRNVIVKGDGSCMIVDFQFAVPFLNNKPLFLDSEFSTVGHRSGQSSVVGTLRYLAPELLDGAINLSDAESALKQADVYALGLIFWEVASRCTDLYQGIDVPPYQAPFQLETGSAVNGQLQTVTFDQMRVLISRNKARPLFPDIWKDSNPAIRLLKETISECWDQEPEARLTALCIKERLADLPSLWRKFKSETASCCVVSSLQQLKSIQNTLNGQGPSVKTESSHAGCSAAHHHLKSSPSSTLLNDSLSESSSYPSSTCYINKFENSLHYKHNGHHHLLHHPYHKHHFYQINLTAAGGGGTNNGNSKKMDLNSNVEKSMHANLAAASSAHGTSNVSQMLLPKVTLPLQPHQARNLCIERNLMLDTSDEHDGLLEQGLKFQNKSYMKSNISRSDDQADHHRSEGEGNEDGQSGGAHHRHHHQAHYPENRTPLIRPSLPLPISYVQNETSSGSQNVKTKETNKLQNRNEHHLSSSSRPMSFSKSSKSASSTSSIFEYIKQKFNLTSHLSKSVREKEAMNKHNLEAGLANSQRNGLLQEWKENVGPDENLEIAAVRIGTLLYAKDSAISTALEYSNQSVNVHQSATTSSNVLAGALASSQNSGNLPPQSSVDNNNGSIGLQQQPQQHPNVSSQSNSSPLISAPSECDLSTTLDILSNMDKLAQLSTTNTGTSMSTTVMGNNANNNSCIQNNNRIDSLASIFLGTSGKAIHATSELVVDESQLLH